MVNSSILAFAGIFSGYFFYLVDCVLYALWLHPDEETSQHFRQQWKEKRYLLAMRMVIGFDRASKRFIHKSAVFLGSFLVLATFVFTSTSSIFAKGFVIGFLMYSSLRLLRALRDETQLRTRFFWDLSSQTPGKTLRVSAVAFILISAFFALLIVSQNS